MSIKFRLAGLLAGGVLGLGVVGVALATDLEFHELFDELDPEHYYIEHEFGGVYSWLHVGRGAVQILPQTVTVNVDTYIEATGVVNSVKLYTGNDANSNGVIEANEWTLVASSTITEAGGNTETHLTATIPCTCDGYRVFIDRSDVADSYDEILLRNKDSDDSF